MEPAKAQFEALVEFVHTKEEFTEEDTENWFAQRDVFERAYAKWLVHMAIKGILKSKKGEKRQ
ncbi:hypothetical protein [Desulfatibacillum alkenivorans]|jgi:hypothetical protein|uniref:hypothetical protein n=1 Tax=Desulfatibacillum alkenivorans TaxID=259354 RepID=UPI000937CA97|nr:hypothetical protein [Desulfatibacillum alkenivorans]